MNKIKILIDYDSRSDKASEKLDEKYFELDRKSLREFGDGDPAYNLTEYDAIILNYSNPKTLQPARIDQLQKFISIQNKLFIGFLNQASGNENNSNLLFLKHIFGLNKENPDILFRVYNHGKSYELTSQGKKSFLYKYLEVDERNWKISFNDARSKIILPLAKNTDDETVAFILNNEITKATMVFIPWIAKNELSFWQLIGEYLISTKSDLRRIKIMSKTIEFFKKGKLKVVLKKN